MTFFLLSAQEIISFPDNSIFLTGILYHEKKVIFFQYKFKKYAVCIGYRMRQERKNKNITQQELAHRLGISYSYYNNIEKGNRSCPIEVLIGICREFGISADRILRDFIPVETEKEIR